MRYCVWCGAQLPTTKDGRHCSAECARAQRSLACRACGNPMQRPAGSGLCGFCLLELREAHERARTAH